MRVIFYNRYIVLITSACYLVHFQIRTNLPSTKFMSSLRTPSPLPQQKLETLYDGTTLFDLEHPTSVFRRLSRGSSAPQTRTPSPYDLHSTHSSDETDQVGPPPYLIANSTLEHSQAALESSSPEAENRNVRKRRIKKSHSTVGVTCRDGGDASSKCSYQITELQLHRQPSELTLEARECSRFYLRRNALCDPEMMLMKQSQREAIQKEVEERRHSLKRRISNYIVKKVPLVGREWEEDLT